MNKKKEQPIDPAPYQEWAKSALGFEFNDPSLIIEALTHRSYINEHQNIKEHYERLEFLGDAVLELITSDYLFRNYHLPEGSMTSIRSALVRTEAIGAAGAELGYAPLVKMSNGEAMDIQRSHESIYADCFEAVLGAVYMDQGYEAAKKIVYEHILDKTEEVIKNTMYRDPKSYFQELAQHYDGATPVYQTLKEEGPDHRKIFTLAVYVAGHCRGHGIGHSKRDAETACAEQGIKYYEALAEQ